MYHVVSLVGPPGAGKTSLVLEPVDAYMSTFDVTKYTVERTCNTFLEVWDTPGLKRFADDRDKCLRRCDAHLLVVKSGDGVDAYWEDLVRTTPGVWALVVVRGDITDALRDVSTRLNIPIYSAKDCDDVWEAAEDALRHVVPRIKTYAI